MNHISTIRNECAFCFRRTGHFYELYDVDTNTVQKVCAKCAIKKCKGNFWVLM